MSLDILRKDVIDDTVVKSINGLEVNASHDKSIINLFEIPLANVSSGQSNSPDINFHGINISLEKYTTTPVNLTNYIIENRTMEKENIISHIDENTSIAKYILNKKSTDTCVEINNAMKTCLSANEKDIADENQELERDLEQSVINLFEDSKEIEIEIMSENEQVDMIYSNKNCHQQENLADKTLSPKKGSLSNVVYSSTPRCNHHVQNTNIHSSKGITSHFESSDIKLSPPIKFDFNNQQPSSTEDEHSENKESKNYSVKVSEKNDICRDDHKSLQNEIDILDTEQPFIVKVLSNDSNPRKVPKRELFSSDREIFDTNNNAANKTESEASNLEKKQLSNISDSRLYQHENKLSSTDVIDIDVEQLIKIDDNDILYLEDDEEVTRECIINMSIEDEALANSFLSMSVDDCETKDELCRSAKKTALHVIKEIKECEIAVTEEIKSYRIPFVSSNPEENKDNNNNEWNYLMSLETDEERYKVVRSIWKNMRIPDPNVNLSCFNFYHKSRKLPIFYGNEEIKLDRKRRREEPIGQEPTAKRCKLFNNVRFFTKTLIETKRLVQQNFKMDEYLLRKKYRNADKLRGRFYEKIDQLEGARREVEAIHSFYKGLPNQTQLDQQNIEKEQMNINKLYDHFRSIYKWSGRAFSHAVNI